MNRLDRTMGLVDLVRWLGPAGAELLEPSAGAKRSRTRFERCSRHTSRDLNDQYGGEG
ncbi:MAG: hypothetical protein ACLQMF_14485 [Rectinemataceae bacterium]